MQYCNPCHFLSSNKNLMKTVVLIIWGCKHSDIKFDSRKQFCKYVTKLAKNQVIYEISGQFLTYLQNWFLLSNLISECLNTLIISTKNFIKFLLLEKRWQGLQYCNFHQYHHIFAVAGWNHPYIVASEVIRVVAVLYDVQKER